MAVSSRSPESVALPPPPLCGDHLALDFVNTRAEPGGQVTEWLPDGARLFAWLVQAAVLDPAAACAMRQSSTTAAWDAAADEARALRGWFRGFLEQHAGSPLGSLDVSELQPLNDLLGRDKVHYGITATGAARPFALRAERCWTSPAQALQPIGTAMADLVCHTDLSLVHRCEGPGCTLMFLDTTKNHHRRFCSPAVCGNRAKQAAHRARARPKQDSGAAG